MTNTLIDNMIKIAVIACHKITDKRHLETYYIPIRWTVEQVYKKFDEKSLDPESEYVYAVYDSDIQRISNYHKYVLSN